MFFRFKAGLLRNPITHPFPRDTSLFIQHVSIRYSSALRNIGISAHIDSGKTTLTERILYYTGRISAIHEVKGKDNIGATMDSMDLEREKGITIQSAATFTTWKDHHVNIIDTPGHVDFTIEVERALRVLDGAILVLCAVGGVQSQTITVDRQMKRYNVPRIVFVNKMDRAGANPFRVVEQLRQKLKLNAWPLQVPIGLEGEFKGVVDLVEMKAYYNEGEKGEYIVEKEIPDDLLEQAKRNRNQFIEQLANINDDIAEFYLDERVPPTALLQKAIREATLSLQFIPVFLGSAYHNKSVQPLLDAVIKYLPAPEEKENYALDMQNGEAKTLIVSDATKPLLSLAFKLEEGRFGQLTYVRVYQGTIRKGMVITNARTQRKVKLARLVRMHSNQMEDVESVKAGEICALFGVDCASGDTFTDGEGSFTMTTMFVPTPVISLSIEPKGRENANFSKALARFQREDPTFKVHLDSESKQTIISGMGELHLEIYLERMKREYNVETITGKPQVAFRETLKKRSNFEYIHKKQSGGSGQYARIKGYIEPLPPSEEDEETNEVNEFVNATVGMNIPHQYIPAIEKGFLSLCEQGVLVGSQMIGVRFVLEDGMAHAVDSSEIAFRLATQYAFTQAYANAQPQILEPIMAVSVSVPTEYQSNVLGLLNKRKGVIMDTDNLDDYTEVRAEVPLNDMFGFSTDLRSVTQGKGEFSMEYLRHAEVTAFIQTGLIEEYKKRREAQRPKK